MNTKQLLELLGGMEGHDPEKEHLEADDALLAFIRALGYGIVADAYVAARNRAEFYYG